MSGSASSRPAAFGTLTRSPANSAATEPADTLAVREYRTQDNHIVMSLREVFGLTQQESRVAVLSGSGMNAREIAHEMGISYETVRSHLKAVFPNVGVNRQAEVSLIIARIDGE